NATGLGLRPDPMDARAPLEHQAGERCHLSIIIPVLDEQDNIRPLIEGVFAVLKRLGVSFEVIAINDGSRDSSLAILRDEASARQELRVVDFRRNFGQTAAMMAGIDHSRGDILVSIDADLQNDPEDIPRLLARLDEGYDVVSGWRQDRQDG